VTATDLASLSEAELYELVSTTDDPDVLSAIATALHSALPWSPQDYQRPPPGGWWTWVFQGGRGSGRPTPDRGGSTNT
jgi:phage terminase large subunit-like protein